jgi:hypothetical protein
LSKAALFGNTLASTSWLQYNRQIIRPGTKEYFLTGARYFYLSRYNIKVRFQNNGELQSNGHTDSSKAAKCSIY